MMTVASREAATCGTASSARPAPPVTTQAKLVRSGPSRVISEAEEELLRIAQA